MSERKLDNETVVDDDFIVVLKARENMKDPCGWRQGYLGFGTPQACWAGHIGKVFMNRGFNGELGQDLDQRCWHETEWKRINNIAEKLGFPAEAEETTRFNSTVTIHPITHITRFNDSHTHEEVLAEFDRRIELWRHNL